MDQRTVGLFGQGVELDQNACLIHSEAVVAVLQMASDQHPQTPDCQVAQLLTLVP